MKSRPSLCQCSNNNRYHVFSACMPDELRSRQSQRRGKEHQHSSFLESHETLTLVHFICCAQTANCDDVLVCVSPSAKLQSSNCAEYKCRWNSKCSDVKECRGHLFLGNNRNGWGMWSERGKSISTTEIYSIKTINNNRNHIELKWIYWDCIGQTTSVRSLAQFVIATCIPPLNGINAIESALRPKTFRFSRTEGHTKGENTFRVRIRR